MSAGIMPVGPPFPGPPLPLPAYSQQTRPPATAAARSPATPPARSLASQHGCINPVYQLLFAIRRPPLAGINPASQQVPLLRQCDPPALSTRASHAASLRAPQLSSAPPRFQDGRPPSSTVPPPSRVLRISLHRSSLPTAVPAIPLGNARHPWHRLSLRVVLPALNHELQPVAALPVPSIRPLSAPLRHSLAAAPASSGAAHRLRRTPPALTRQRSTTHQLTLASCRSPLRVLHYSLHTPAPSSAPYPCDDACGLLPHPPAHPPFSDPLATQPRPAPPVSARALLLPANLGCCVVAFGELPHPPRLYLLPTAHPGIPASS
ncbi:hypothetical protein B0H13DRAFT_2567545 [Mycena leptocephala]|nr:hypothetical protein B0H13DRAFT_2567545 [Mycena leptocephala]